ncbi:hypothetical protein V8E36_006678 [Tilletia maclaganii]
MDLPKRGSLPRKHRSSASKDLVAGVKAKKGKSAVTAARIGALAAAGGATAANEDEHQLTKAEKRAVKRAELMQSVGAPLSQTQARLAALPPHLLSKSALRRQKRREREQLAGNVEGLRDVASAMDEVQVEAERAAKVGAVVQKRRIGGGEGDGLLEEAESTGASRPAVSAKKRKQVLAAELGRQQHILGDPAFAESPFAALRQHARNTLAFSQPLPSAK